jgi:ADP-ribose pyrophosphatase
MKKPTIEKTYELCSTKFLSLKQSTYKDKEGTERKWDFVSRKTGKGIVTIIPFNSTMRFLLFVKQPRVPVGKIVLSFPAGIIDDGETPEDAACRELQEETGYECAKVLSVSPLLPKSAGLTDESTYQVQCIVSDKPGAQHLEETENIETFWMTPRAFYKKAMTLDVKKYAVENETWNFISGIVMARKYKV